MKMQMVSAVRKCERCGNDFTQKDYRQRVCKKDCGRTRPPTSIKFVGVDGEGRGDDPRCYVLFGIGDRSIENPDGLSWKECFSFLYREFERRGKGCAFVGFFLGYDFTQILKSLPEDRARMLLTKEGIGKRAHRTKGRQPHPVECEGWQFDILGNKRLRIRPKMCGCFIASCKCPKASWCYLCDVGGFFQTSFLNVIDPKGWKEPICSQEEYELIREGKARRASAQLDSDMRKYMSLEIQVLERVMSVLAFGLESIGIRLTPKQWFGPGQAAAQWLRGKVKPSSELLENVPDWYKEAARESYYGGWFETFAHGCIRGNVWEYDINSAYPSVIAKLPCLEHGTYTKGNGPLPRNPDYCLVKARVQMPGFYGHSVQRRVRGLGHIGTMLHRNKDGSICRPAITEGWFWLSEIESAIRAGFIDSRAIQYLEWVNYDACGCRAPFEDIQELYQKRLEYGKTSPMGKGSKLVYNSAYGKFAQSIGSPTYGNPIYASLITRGCREMVTDAIATHPSGTRAVAMVATDAVFFLEPHPGLEISEKLGAWDCTIRSNLTIFKPGVYWDDETREQIRRNEKPKFKARGINAEQFATQIEFADLWFASWEEDKYNEWPDVEFESGFSLVTATQALAWGKWEMAGSSDSKPVLHSSNPYRKRSGIYWDSVDGIWRSNVIQRDYDWGNSDWREIRSKPYEKRFGMDDPFSDETKGQFGITEDGYIVDVYRWALMNTE